MDAPSPVPAKKMPAAPQLGDKYNIKPPVLKRPRYVSLLLTLFIPTWPLLWNQDNMSLTWLSHGSNSVWSASLFVFFSSGPLENTPFEKKYKPLNTPSNSAKEIKVKIIPAQRESRPTYIQTGADVDLQLCDCLAAAMESTGFLDALNSAPVPGIKIKKKKPGANNAKAASPTSTKVQDRLVWCPLEKVGLAKTS